MNKIPRSLPFALLLVLAACSNKVPEDGFKQLKYGLTLNQLKAQGIVCKADDLCSPEHNTDVAKQTIFGHPADVMVWTKNGRLAQVDVNTDIPQQELEKLAVGEFGSPKTFDYTTFSGGRATQLLWRSGSGTSVSMIRRAPESTALPIGSGSISYNDKAATDDLLKRAAKAATKSGDV